MAGDQSSRSEGIDRVTFSVRANKRLQIGAVRNIDTGGKQVFETLLDAHVLEQPDICLWLYLDQDVDVAIGAIIAARAGRTRPRGSRRALARRARSPGDGRGISADS